MLPPLLTVSARACLFPEPLFSRRNLLFFRSFSSSSKDRNPRVRRTPRGRGWGSIGKSPIFSEDGPLVSTNVSHSSKSRHLVTPQPRQTSPHSVTPQPGRSYRRKAIGSGNGRGLEKDCKIHPFDICRTETVGPATLRNPLLELNRERRKEQECLQDGPQYVYLRSGIILLKNYVDHRNQVKIIKKCRDLGIGVGGFYRPSYRDGSKLHLQMMCLGKNWDPESRLYIDKRPIDGAKPPMIPEEFRTLVDGAIRTSHDYLTQNYEINVEEEIPWMSPDICIVNFYNKSGRLGLHQDRDESKESLHKGLPVVSFSLGDQAEFLYGSERAVDNAAKVLLESGDVLIFGGNSRLIFHGVSSILADTAPKQLIEDTKLRPGRLNLTFRQY